MGSHFKQSSSQAVMEQAASCLLLFMLINISICLPFPQDSSGSLGYGKQPDGYFQYVNVPAHKEYEFGWNRGNPEHYISRYEQSKTTGSEQGFDGEITMVVMENTTMNTTMDRLIQSNTLRQNTKLPLSQNTVIHQIMYE